MWQCYNTRCGNKCLENNGCQLLLEYKVAVLTMCYITIKGVAVLQCKVSQCVTIQGVLVSVAILDVAVIQYMVWQ